MPDICFLQVPAFDIDDPDGAPLEPSQGDSLPPEQPSDPESDVDPDEPDPEPHPSETWSEQARTMLWQCKWDASGEQHTGHWSRPPDYIKASSSFKQHPHAAGALGLLYGRWAHTLEQYLCDLVGVPGVSKAAHLGRGKAVAFKTIGVSGCSFAGAHNTDAGVRS